MRRHAWYVIGLLLLASGVVVALSTRAQTADFGWLAYTPANSGADWQMEWGGSSALVVARWQIVGAALAVAGLVLLSAGIGYRFGHRRNRSRVAHPAT